MKHVILIPTYNEAETIEKIISVIFNAYDNVYIKVIDDNSPDGTAQIVMSLMDRYPRLSLLSRKGKEGLGRAYIHGFKEVMKDRDVTHVITMDADMSHDPEHLAEMMQYSKTYDVVVGSRYISKGKTVGWELWRRALSFFGNLYARFITRTPVRDLTGGFNCMSVAYLKYIDLDAIDSSGYAFQIEMKYTLHSKGAQIVEIPIVFANRVGGESKISNHIVSEGILAPWRMVMRQNKVSVKTFLPEMVCPLCESSRIYFYTKKNNHNLYVCDACKLMFVYPLPETADIYKPSYFSGAGDGFGYVDYDADKEPMVPVFEKYLDLIAKAGVTSGRLLDVGAATGFFMKLAQKRGFEVFGVEVSDFAAQKGRDTGLDIITGEWSDFPNGHFDVVTMFDVIEHVYHPKETITRAHHALRDGGLLVINTPDARSIVARIFGPRWHLIVPPEHIHYFSPENLGKFLTTQGFTVIESGSIGKKFTLQYIFATLYKWQKFILWKWCMKLFSKGFLSRWSIPVNTHDNFFMIAQKNEI